MNHLRKLLSGSDPPDRGKAKPSSSAGPDDRSLSKILADVGPYTSLNHRLIHMKPLYTFISKNNMSPTQVESVWAAVYDLVHERKDKPKDDVSRVISMLLKYQYAHVNPLLKSAFFVEVVQNNKFSIEHRLGILDNLTQGGLDVDVVQSEVLETFSEWLAQHERMPLSLTIAVIVVLANVFKHNFDLFEENRIARTLDVLFDLSNSTIHETVLEHALYAFDVCVRFGHVPHGALAKFVATHCRAVNIDSCCQRSWRTIHALLTGPRGHICFNTLLSLLERPEGNDGGARVTHTIIPSKDGAKDLSLLRGAVFFVGMSCWGSYRISSLKVSFQMVLPYFLDAMSHGYPNVAHEVGLSIHRLMKKYGKDLFLEWPVVFNILKSLHGFVEAFEADGASSLRGMALPFSRVFRQILEQLQSLLNEDLYLGDKTALVEILEDYATRGDASFMRHLLAHRLQMIHPVNDEWRKHLCRMLDVYFCSPKLPLNLRRESLEALERLYDELSSFYGDEMIHAVLPTFKAAAITKSHHPQIQVRVLMFLGRTAARVSDPDAFESILGELSIAATKAPPDVVRLQAVDELLRLFQCLLLSNDADPRRVVHAFLALLPLLSSNKRMVRAKALRMAARLRSNFAFHVGLSTEAPALQSPTRPEAPARPVKWNGETQLGGGQELVVYSLRVRSSLHQEDSSSRGTGFSRGSATYPSSVNHQEGGPSLKDASTRPSNPKGAFSTVLPMRSLFRALTSRLQFETDHTLFFLVMETVKRLASQGMHLLRDADVSECASKLAWLLKDRIFGISISMAAGANKTTQLKARTITMGYDVLRTLVAFHAGSEFSVELQSNVVRCFIAGIDHSSGLLIETLRICLSGLALCVLEFQPHAVLPALRSALQVLSRVSARWPTALGPSVLVASNAILCAVQRHSSILHHGEASLRNALNIPYRVPTSPQSLRERARTLRRPSGGSPIRLRRGGSSRGPSASSDQRGFFDEDDRMVALNSCLLLLQCKECPKDLAHLALRSILRWFRASPAHARPRHLTFIWDVLRSSNIPSRLEDACQATQEALSWSLRMQCGSNPFLRYQEDSSFLFKGCEKKVCVRGGNSVVTLRTGRRGWTQVVVRRPAGTELWTVRLHNPAAPSTTTTANAEPEGFPPYRLLLNKSASKTQKFDGVIVGLNGVLDRQKELDHEGNASGDEMDTKSSNDGSMVAVTTRETGRDATFPADTMESFLHKLGMQEYIPHLQSEHVNFDSLPLLSDSDLGMLGVPLGPRRIILNAIANHSRRVGGTGLLASSGNGCDESSSTSDGESAMRAEGDVALDEERDPSPLLSGKSSPTGAATAHNASPSGSIDPIAQQRVVGKDVVSSASTTEGCASDQMGFTRASLSLMHRSRSAPNLQGLLRVPSSGGEEKRDVPTTSQVRSIDGVVKDQEETHVRPGGSGKPCSGQRPLGNYHHSDDSPPKLQGTNVASTPSLVPDDGNGTQEEEECVDVGEEDGRDGNIPSGVAVVKVISGDLMDVPAMLKMSAPHFTLRHQQAKKSSNLSLELAVFTDKTVSDTTIDSDSEEVGTSQDDDDGVVDHLARAIESDSKEEECRGVSLGPGLVLPTPHLTLLDEEWMDEEHAGQEWGLGLLFPPLPSYEDAESALSIGLGPPSPLVSSSSSPLHGSSSGGVVEAPLHSPPFLQRPLSSTDRSSSMRSTTTTIATNTEKGQSTSDDHRPSSHLSPQGHKALLHEAIGRAQMVSISDGDAPHGHGGRSSPQLLITTSRLVCESGDGELAAEDVKQDSQPSSLSSAPSSYDQSPQTSSSSHPTRTKPTSRTTTRAMESIDAPSHTTLPLLPMGEKDACRDAEDGADDRRLPRERDLAVQRAHGKGMDMAKRANDRYEDVALPEPSPRRAPSALLPLLRVQQRYSHGNAISTRSGALRRDDGQTPHSPEPPERSDLPSSNPARKDTSDETFSWRITSPHQRRLKPAKTLPAELENPMRVDGDHPDKSVATRGGGATSARTTQEDCGADALSSSGAPAASRNVPSSMNVTKDIAVAGDASPPPPLSSSLREETLALGHGRRKREEIGASGEDSLEMKQYLPPTKDGPANTSASTATSSRTSTASIAESGDASSSHSQGLRKSNPRVSGKGGGSGDGRAAATPLVRRFLHTSAGGGSKATHRSSFRVSSKKHRMDLFRRTLRLEKSLRHTPPLAIGDDVDGRFASPPAPLEGPSKLPISPAVQAIEHIGVVNRPSDVSLRVCSELDMAIRVLDSTPCTDTTKVGLLYRSAGQTSLREMLSNSCGSLRYHEFIMRLGHLMRLRDADGYTGGLDSSNDMDGEYALAWDDGTSRIVFHVGTLMPTLGGDDDGEGLHLNKLRHIGNDFIVVVFDEAEADDPVDPSWISGEFNYVTIVLTAQASGLFLIKVHGKKMIQSARFGPIAPGEMVLVSQAAAPDVVRQIILSSISVIREAAPSRPCNDNVENRMKQIQRLAEKFQA